MGALSDESATQYLSENYVPVFQQVGDFEVTNVDGKLQKNGGNVASYFCTPDGYVIHAVLGPVKGEVLEAEARWASETWAHAKRNGHTPYQVAYLVAQRHYNASMHQASLAGTGKNAKGVHELFAKRPMAPLAGVTEEVFERLLGQKISHAGPTLVHAERAMEKARELNLPVLLVLDRSDDTYQNFTRAYSYLPRGIPLRAVMPKFVVIAAPLKHLPALSYSLKADSEPYQLPDRTSPAFIVLDSHGKQLDAFTGATDPDLFAARLARGLADAYEANPPPISQLRATLRTLKTLERSQLPEAQAEARFNWERISRLAGDQLASAHAGF